MSSISKMDTILLCCLISVILGPVKGQTCKDEDLSVVPPISNAEEGNSIRISSNLLCVPGPSYKYEWYREDEKVFTYNSSTKDHTPHDDLVGRSYGQLFGNSHSLNITSVSIKDNGSWKCRILTTTTATSEPVSMMITVTPVSADIKITGNSSPLAGTEPQYICAVERMKPELSIKWVLDGKEIVVDEPKYFNNSDGTVALSTSLIIDVQKVKAYVLICSLDDNGVENALNFEAAGPATIEKMKGSEGEVDSTETLHITCTASGTNVDITWNLNDTELADHISSEIVDGPFRYEQPKGLQSNLTIELPGGTSTCKEIQYYNGNYTCRASAAGGTSDSEQHSVTLRYSPRGVTTGNTTKDVKVGKPADIECPVCGYPSIHSYIWTVESGSKPSGVTGWNTNTLSIDPVEDVHFNYKYICTAENDIGKINVTVVLAIDQTVDAQNIGAIVGGVLAGLALCGATVGGGYMYYKHRQKRKDEEVAAYAESGNSGGTHNVINSTNGSATVHSTANASPVYAEVNKGDKKKSRKNNAAPVYSEVDKDKKKKQPNTAEHSGPVYSQVNKRGRPLPQLQPKPRNGSTNTGPVYSEVKKPNQGRLTPIEAQHQGDGNAHEEVGYVRGNPLPPINARHYDNTGQRNEHGGLHYADVDFLRQADANKQSHSTKNTAYEPTEYAQIDHRKSTGIVV